MNQLELRDIHLPDDSLWWPLAPGWWLLVLLLIVLAGLFWWLRKHYRRRGLYRSCQRQFSQLRSDIIKGQSENAVTEISTFLRRVLISYQGRDSSAGLSGENWIAAIRKLDQASIFNDEQIEFLAYAQYQQNASCDIDDLLTKTGHWVRQLPKEPDRAPV